MKKFLVILAVLATASVFFSSCGKGCKCTYKEDGKKIYVRESDYRYFDKLDYKDECVGNSDHGTTWDGVSWELDCK